MGYCTRGIRFHTRKKYGIFFMKSGRKSIKTRSERVKTWVPPTKICIVPSGTMINFYIDQRGGTPWPDKLHSPELGHTCRNYSTLPPLALRALYLQLASFTTYILTTKLMTMICCCLLYTSPSPRDRG